MTYDELKQKLTRTEELLASARAMADIRSAELRDKQDLLDNIKKQLQNDIEEYGSTMHIALFTSLKCIVEWITKK